MPARFRGGGPQRRTNWGRKKNEDGSRGRSEGRCSQGTPPFQRLSAGLDQRHHLGFAQLLSDLEWGFTLLVGDAEVSLGIQEHLMYMEGEGERDG